MFSFYEILSISILSLFLTAFARRRIFALWTLSFFLFIISCFVYDFTSFFSDLNRLADTEQLAFLSSNSWDYLFYSPFVLLSSFLDPHLIFFIYQAISIGLVYTADYFFYLYFKNSFSSTFSLGYISFSYLTLLGIFSLFGQLRFGLFCSYLLFLACFLLYSRSCYANRNLDTVLLLPLPFLHFNSFIALAAPYLLYQFSSLINFRRTRFKPFLSKTLCNIPLTNLLLISFLLLAVPIFPVLLPLLVTSFSYAFNFFNTQLSYYIMDVSLTISFLNIAWLVFLYCLVVFLGYRNSYLITTSLFKNTFILILSFSFPLAFTYLYSRAFFLFAYIILILYSSYLSSLMLRRTMLSLFLFMFIIRARAYFLPV